MFGNKTYLSFKVLKIGATKFLPWIIQTFIEKTNTIKPMKNDKTADVGVCVVGFIFFFIIGVNNSTNNIILVDNMIEYLVLREIGFVDYLL